MGEELVKVPLSALLTVNDVPETFRNKLMPIRVHSLLASFLATGDNTDPAYAPWASTWPAFSEFRESMPLCWPQQGMAALSEELLNEVELKSNAVLPMPPAIEPCDTRVPNTTYSSDDICGLLPTQRRKLRADWELVSRIIPGTSFEKYLYYWLVINTRSLYYEMPNVKTQPSREDCMVLCPFIDLFNHNDSGVS